MRFPVLLSSAVAACVAASSISAQAPRVTRIGPGEIIPPMAGGHWVPEMVELAGGRDLLGRSGQPSRYVSWDEIVEAQPEVLVLMPCGYDLESTVAQAELLRRAPRARELPAVRRGQVYAVDGSGYFNRPGPRLVQGVALLAAILHPELFDGLDAGAARCVPATTVV